MNPNEYILAEIEKSTRKERFINMGPDRPTTFVLLWLILVSFLFATLTTSKTTSYSKKSTTNTGSHKKGPVAYEY